MKYSYYPDFLDNSPKIARVRRSVGFMSIRKCFITFILILLFAGCNRGKSTDSLIGDLSSKDDGDRIKAVRFLQHRKIDAATVVPALIESLKDSDGDVRRSAAIGLGNFGAEAKSAIEALEELKRDKDRRIHDAASVAISRIEGRDK
jgi:HEAT repeats